MIYDITIIGAGPAGLTAAIYAGRAKMKTAVVSENVPGGQAMLTDEIENYPGFVSPVKGPELLESMRGQAGKLEVDFKETRADSVTREKDVFRVKTPGGEIESLSVIVATGAAYKKLGVKGEAEFTGRGVSYCGVCDAPFFRNKEIAVVGGGDTAVYEATHLLKFCSRLHMVHRRDRLRATKVMQDRVLKDEKAVMHWDSVVEEISGAKTVEALKLKNVKTGKTELIPLKGVFIFVGISPNAGPVKGLVDLDDKGFIMANGRLESSCKGLFACGDIRNTPLRQISTAVGDGAIAALSAQHYVDKLKGQAYN